MSLPSFDKTSSVSAISLCTRIADRIRLERRRQNLTQSAFAEACQIPLRTYKRFELGKCDSLEVFIRIIIQFDRISALELLFPPKEVEVNSRSPAATLDRLLKKVNQY
ncbi:MAG: helix-turn-helix transcriptional regulator [Pseudomonadota bacterium]